MLSSVYAPILAAELSVERMVDLEHIHAVKARIQPLITLIIGSRMEHFIIDKPVIISVQPAV